jgi:hypothetical protein
MMNLSEVNYLDRAVKQAQNNILLYMSSNMMGSFNPDINGYTLIFFVPPALSGLSQIQHDFQSGTQVSDGDNITDRLKQISEFITFAAIDFTPPQEQVNTDKISSRSGAIPYATEITTSEQVTVTYLDNMDLALYKFHQIWIYYMWEILEGKIRPSDDFIYEVETNERNFRALDYAGSFYIVKYKPDLKTITYIGKCIGVFPQSLPSKELIGQRTANELTTLPFNYLCSAYRGEVVTEGFDSWILNEFLQDIAGKFSAENTTEQFSQIFATNKQDFFNPIG